MTTAFDGHRRIARPSISRRLTLVFALACGISVANNYYAQPLLDSISREFRVSAATAGLFIMVAQLGYAGGLVLLVPLGDVIERRMLIVGVLCTTAVACVLAALARSAGGFALAVFLIGFTSVVTQILMPFAASLANDAQRGRVVGTVMSGLLIGVLLARTLAGGLAQVAGWRSIYWFAAGLLVVLAGYLRSVLPRQRQSLRLSYGKLLHSIVRLLADEPILRRRAVYGALVFAMFSILWTSLAFLLADPPYHYSKAAIGLFGLAGAGGAFCAAAAGRLADRGLTAPATGGFIATACMAFGLLALGGHSLAALIAGIVLLDLGVQGTHILNQSAVYALNPEARSRLTTAYMTPYFIGGAVGSAGSGIVYSRVAWSGVCVFGASVGGIAMLFFLSELISQRAAHAKAGQ